MSKENYGVHISHCCYIHGCKYGDKDCPVASGEVAQKHLCYDCTEEYEPYTLEEIESLRKTKSYRPTYKQLKDKVADLEAKLADSEEQKETLRISQSSTHKTLMQLNDELLKTQKQLAEKDRKIKGLGLYTKNVIDFAVEQLEKVRKSIKNLHGQKNCKIGNSYIQKKDKLYNKYIIELDVLEEVLEIFDNQIKQLNALNSMPLEDKGKN